MINEYQVNRAIEILREGLEDAEKMADQSANELEITSEAERIHHKNAYKVGYLSQTMKYALARLGVEDALEI